MIYGIIIILAYLLGSIPSGLIVGKLFYGVDIREHGSGNLGGTNTFRTLGVKAGMIVTIADILKGTLAASLPFFFGSDMHHLVAGVFAVIGHMYPLFAGFRGGKAVATSGGVLLAYVPLMFLIILGVFFLSLYITKYVSLSSILAAAASIIYALILGDIPLIIVVSILGFFVIYRHRANIKRIRDKTEPKIKWLG
ncbi:glycerol-3-phosphate 1-O-acyltransferase PlsY [Bacillus sp. CMF12]|uniref:glycerol-3-phosphate 1-O-acyltransferase PlsY n=1 Tax=Bacillaceae TaxID=186817 RepID=UPI001FB54E2A|nr:MULTISPECIES: glycerol-3-phosphate 1-O-acyltransferase PlsY [Bacillaceae]MDF2040130.1 glycerol-3-phosphate 1-O-acyltransferase PlsY [Cytobacillus oceanisediminis]UOE57576.1 glycerol-3-phosphate 1-O-acyltransferase PlsY [Cytobacillus oceanisediminis]USK52038.1 glycerol-3-phosphate 1-O-acyltransferase PlsY [Bacillus sp. CMF12]